MGNEKRFALHVRGMYEKEEFYYQKDTDHSGGCSFVVCRILFLLRTQFELAVGVRN